jgi:hypothetical protein
MNLPQLSDNTRKTLNIAGLLAIWGGMVISGHASTPAEVQFLNVIQAMLAGLSVHASYVAGVATVQVQVAQPQPNKES